MSDLGKERSHRWPSLPGLGSGDGRGPAQDSLCLFHEAKRKRKKMNKITVMTHKHACEVSVPINLGAWSVP